MKIIKINDVGIASVSYIPSPKVDLVRAANGNVLSLAPFREIARTPETTNPFLMKRVHH